jgi:aminopeptidase N
MKKLLFCIVLLVFFLSACSLPYPIITTITPQGMVEKTAASQPAAVTPPAAASAQTPQAAFGSDGSGDPYFPQLGNGGYDVTHYTLDLSVDMDAGTIRGAATIEATATQTLARFNLDYAGPTVGGVEVNGQAAGFNLNNGELVITPPAALAASQPFTTRVAYSGMPGSNLPPGTPVFSQGWIPYDQGVMVASEPAGQESWYPLNETPADKASYTLRITVAKPWVVAAIGLLKNVSDNGDTRTYLWQTDNPVAPYLVTLGIAKFSQETDTSSDVLVRSYFGEGYPESAKTGFALIPQMISYYESLFGPYPFEAYGVVGHNTRLGFSLETQTLTVFGNSFTNEAVVAHELAHSWFGDSVTLANWPDVWLNEGFASFAARLWQEHRQGKDAANQAISQTYQALLPAETSGFKLGDPGPDGLFSKQVYARGELTLDALRARLGDEVIFNILHTYAKRHYHANVTSADFISVANEVSGQKLDDFFQAWLYQVRLPDIPELGLTHP